YAHHGPRLANDFTEGLQILAQVRQGIRAAVVDQDDDTQGALPQDLPHEVEANLTWRAIQTQHIALRQRHLAIVHRCGGGGLPRQHRLGTHHVGTHRRDLADGSDGRGLAGAPRASENQLVLLASHDQRAPSRSAERLVWTGIWYGLPRTSS